MRNLIIFMLLVGVFVLSKRSCHFSGSNWGWGVRGEGPMKTETRNQTGFHGVEMDISGEVEVSVSDHYSIEVTAQENLLPLLKTLVTDDGVLHIYFDERVSNSENLKIKVSAPAYDVLSLGGSGMIKVVTPVKSEKLSLDLAGSGDIVLTQAEADSISGDIAGSGSIQLNGKVNHADFQIAGSGDVRAKDLAINNCKAEISGSGSVTVGEVSQSLKAEVSGSGDVRYSGTPSVQSDVSGSGSVEKN